MLQMKRTWCKIFLSVFCQFYL